MQLRKLKIIELDEVNSTNDYLKDNYHQYDNLTVIKTKFQTKGRGQFERSWESLKDENLLFSMLLKGLDVNKINILKQIVLESLLILLETLNVKGIFKEPNDVYVEDKKILGILIETKLSENNEQYKYVIIGIGLNVNQEEFNEKNATSLKKLKNKIFEINDIFSSFISIFMKNFNEKMRMI